MLHRLGAILVLAFFSACASRQVGDPAPAASRPAPAEYQASLTGL